MMPIRAMIWAFFVLIVGNTSAYSSIPSFRGYCGTSSSLLNAGGRRDMTGTREPKVDRTPINKAITFPEVRVLIQD